MYPRAPPPGPDSAERTQGSGRNFSPAREPSCPCRGGAETSWADVHPSTCIPAKEDRSLLELLLAPSPSHPHPQLVVVVQSGLSQPWQGDRDETSQAWLGRQTLRRRPPWQRGCVSQPAGHIWDESCGISSAVDGKLDNLLWNYISWAARVSYAVQKLFLPLPGCLAVNTLQSWRAKYIGAESSWKTWPWVWGAPGNLPPSSYANLAPRACRSSLKFRGSLPIEFSQL